MADTDFEKEVFPGDNKGDTSNRHKILVAEDNPVVQKGLNNFLVKWGYEPVEALTGDLAWQALENDPSIRLAILDWNLPGLSGMQVCQRIRTRRNSYIYTVIFSARKSVEEQVLALEGGADDYLVKPAKPSLLRARLAVGLRLLEQIDAPPAP